jgi:hypothetical protein
MSDKDKNQKLSEKSQEINQSVQQLRSDVLDVRETVLNDSVNRERSIKWFLSNYKLPLGILGVITFWVYMATNPDITVPEWFTVALAGSIAGVVVGYPFAKKIAKLFVIDNRIPVLEVDPENMNDVGLVWVPTSRVREIEVEGELSQISTIKGMGYECEQFTAVEEKGKQKLKAKGTWYAGKTGLEIKRAESEIQTMRDKVKPYVDKALAYERIWPYLKYEVQEEVINQFTQTFESVDVTGMGSLSDRIDKIVEDNEPSDMDREEMEQVLSESMKNGEFGK